MIEWWQRAEPPGGWLVFALIVLGVTAAVGLAVPETPPGRILRLGLGGGILLAIVWPAWLVWVLVRRRSTPVSHALALLGLSVAWLIVLAAHETGSGGTIGEALLGVLDTSFGRLGGLLLLAGLVLIALVVLIGTHRVMAAARTGLGQIRRRGTPRRSAIRIAGPRSAASEPSATAPRRASDVVILGPSSPDRQPARIRRIRPTSNAGTRSSSHTAGSDRSLPFWLSRAKEPPSRRPT